jgi:uncharacterized protein DUF6221
MQTDDIAAWLTGVWDEDEAQAAATGQPDGYYPDPYDPGSPMHHESVLARIGADRQILALHSGSAPWCAWSQDGNDTHLIGDPCDTARLLALPYADRPGYQESWRPAPLL